MTNSKHHVDLSEITERLILLINNAILEYSFDLPIQNAASKFAYQYTSPFSNEKFIVIVSKYIQHLYKQLPGNSQKLTKMQAKVESIKLLEGYQGAIRSGYHAAFIEVLHGGAYALNSIIVQLTQSIIETQKKKYIHWAFTNTVDSLDWKSKIELAIMLKAEWRHFLPEGILDLSPAQLADNLRLLIESVILNAQGNVKH